MEAQVDECPSFRLDYIDDAVSAAPPARGDWGARARPVPLRELSLTCSFVAIGRCIQVLREMHSCVRDEFVLRQAAEYDTSQLQPFANMVREKLFGDGKVWPFKVLGPPKFSSKIGAFKTAVEKIIQTADCWKRDVQRVRKQCICYLSEHTDYLTKVGDLSLMSYFRGEGIVANAGKVASLERASAARWKKYDSRSAIDRSGIAELSLAAFNTFWTDMKKLKSSICVLRKAHRCGLLLQRRWGFVRAQDRPFSCMSASVSVPPTPTATRPRSIRRGREGRLWRDVRSHWHCPRREGVAGRTC